MNYLAFEILVWLHIAAGATGAVALWVPLMGRKGSTEHKRWGRVFTTALLFTGCFAVGMSTLTVLDPVGMHPHLAGRFSPEWLRGMFGWMMLHNAILTINLVWYGWNCVWNRHHHAGNRSALNLALQGLLLLAATNLAYQGWRLGEVLMMALSVVGFATVGTNLAFLLNRAPQPQDWLREHLKALVGAGISVYTAFFAFGSVRTFPWLALHPVTWSVPLLTGLGIILYHWHKLARQRRRPVPRPA